MIGEECQQANLPYHDTKPIHSMLVAAVISLPLIALGLLPVPIPEHLGSPSS
jgi:hypothetical protein